MEESQSRSNVPIDQKALVEHKEGLLSPPSRSNNAARMIVHPDDEFDAKTLELHKILYTGQVFKKVNRFGIGQNRFIWVDPNRNHLFWMKEGGDKQKFNGRLWIARIKSIIPERSKTVSGFTIVTPSRSLQLICPNKSIQDKWIRALEVVLEEKQPQERGKHFSDLFPS
jgi:hypothetical protein